MFAWTENVQLAIAAIRTVGFALFARRCLLFGTIAIAFWIAGPRAGNAASLLWSPNGVTPGGGGTGTWNTSTALWYNGTSFQSWTNAPVNDAVFGGSAGTVTLGVPITVENLMFNTTGYTIAGSTLTLGGVTPTIGVVPGGTATISSVIAGTIGLTQAGGTGTLILTGTNTYTGGTTINAGTLQIGAGGATGSVTGNIVDNAALVFDRSNALTYGGIISGTGSVTQAGTGTLTLSGTNTYTGATTINGGTLALSGTGSIAASSQVNVAAAAGTFSIAGTTAGATIKTLNGVANSNVTLGARTLTIANGSTTYAGIIGGTGGLSLTAGTETLSGTNTYTGATTINGGTLALSGTGSIAASSQVNLANAAGTFSIAGTTAGATIKTLNGVANRT